MLAANNSEGGGSGILLTKTYRHILGQTYKVLLDAGKYQKIYFSEKILQVSFCAFKNVNLKKVST